MKKIVINCDRCKEEITGNPYRIIISIVNVDRESGKVTCDSVNLADSLDYCESCVINISDEIKPDCFTPHKSVGKEREDKEPDAPEPVPTPPERGGDETTVEAKPKRKYKRADAPSIDIDKILALRKAGWKVKDIAWDMHVSESAVSMAIYNHKKKQKNQSSGESGEWSS